MYKVMQNVRQTVVEDLERWNIYSHLYQFTQPMLVLRILMTFDICNTWCNFFYHSSKFKIIIDAVIVVYIFFYNSLGGSNLLYYFDSLFLVVKTLLKQLVLLTCCFTRLDVWYLLVFFFVICSAVCFYKKFPWNNILSKRTFDVK